MEKRYVILELSDAKALASQARSLAEGHASSVDPILERIEAETGADIEDIVAQLKGLDFCHACVVEGQQQYCECLTAHKLGRRLSRLVDRANGKPGFEGPAEQPLERTVENVLGRAQPEDPEAAAYREAVRQCQMEAAQDIVDAVGHALSDLVNSDHAIGVRLFHEMSGRIAAEIDAWRIRYSDVQEFLSADYSAIAKEGPKQGAITIVWSEAFQTLSHGNARVRMNPLPKHFRN